MSIEPTATLKLVLACSNYAEAFESTLHSNADLRSAVAGAASAPALAAALRSVDLEVVLSLDNAHRVFRESYGYESWLLGPELGVRNLVSQALERFRPHMEQAASGVRGALLEAAQAALQQLPCTGGGCSGSGDSTSGGSSSDEWLQQQLLHQAQQCIAAWHGETVTQLGKLLAAEQLCPAQEHFVQLRSQLQQLLLGAACGPLQGSQGPEPARASLARSKSALAEPAQQAGSLLLQVQEQAQQQQQQQQQQEQEQQQQPHEHNFFMGWLEKLNRHGRWQRRWFVLHPEQQLLWYMQHPGEEPARAVIALRGATLMGSATQLGSSAGAARSAVHAPVRSKDAQLVFQLRLKGAAASSGGSAGAGGTKQVVAVVTLRASTASAKQAWLQQLQAAVTGDQPGGQAAAAAVQPLPLLRSSSSKSSSSAGSGDGGKEEGMAATHSAGVPRKISTAVFASEAEGEAAGASMAACSSDTTAASASVGQEQGEEETALLAAIASQAAQRQPSLQEAAVLRCTVAAARECVEAARSRLAGLTQRLVSTQMLLNRREELREGLLAMLLLPGATPPQSRAARII